MSDIRLFRIGPDSTPSCVELPSIEVVKERRLQKIVEAHCGELLGVRFLASEYTTGKAHAGRIDTLGLDGDQCPVIIEYRDS
ncbi:MAG: hypothetical protein IT439_04005 [Phycisphaerales bacterium]|nr:hypothetical protein [Phycisphaerales bacterium]